MSDNIWVDTKVLLKHANPMDHWIWYGKPPPKPLSFQQWHELLHTCKPIHTPVGTDAHWRHHIGRVRALMDTGWDDAIHIDVGIPWLGCQPRWIVDDGNHRLVAAALLQLPHIVCDLTGCVKTLEKMLKVKLQAPAVSTSLSDVSPS